MKHKKFKNHEILVGKELHTVVAIRNTKTGRKSVTVMGKSTCSVYGEGRALQDYYWSVFSYIKQNIKKKGEKYDDFEVSVAEYSEETYEKASAWCMNMTIEQYRAWEKETQIEFI